MWGRVGFDGGMDARGACRGAGGLVKHRPSIAANDTGYALAA